MHISSHLINQIRTYFFIAIYFQISSFTLHTKIFNLKYTYSKEQYHEKLIILTFKAFKNIFFLIFRKLFGVARNLACLAKGPTYPASLHTCLASNL